MERKNILLGTRPEGRSRDKVLVDVKLENGRLSIMGESYYAALDYPPDMGRYAGGQIVELLGEITRSAAGWTLADIRKLAEVWDRWHLNDMRAGCEHQRAMGWTYDEHPSEPCPVCGYRFGSAWLTEELPPEIVDYATGLIENGKP